jgi:hypothetical protein
LVRFTLVIVVFDMSLLREFYRTHVSEGLRL